MRTTSLNIALTSWMPVETTGLPAAMYSSVFVGLMQRVASLSAKGMMHASRPASQAPGVDLHHGPDHDDVPPRIGVGQRRHEVDVEALVDHAEEAEPRPR